MRLGLGIGIVAEMAVRDDTNADLVVRPLGQLVGMNLARVAFKRGAYLRNFVYKFAELLSDRLDRNLIAKALPGQADDFGLCASSTRLPSRPSCRPSAPPSSP